MADFCLLLLSNNTPFFGFVTKRPERISGSEGAAAVREVHRFQLLRSLISAGFKALHVAGGKERERHGALP